MVVKKSVGYIKGKTFVTFRRPEHIMRKWTSFGISCDILETLKKHGVENIHILFSSKKTRILYICPLSKFLESSLEHDNYGDIQKHVPLYQMKKIVLEGY